jgi:hypothetical protein
LVVASDDKMTDCSNVQRNEKKNDTAGERRSFCARISFRLVSVDARESLFFLPRYATYLSSCKVRSATYAHKYSSRTPPPLSLSLSHTHTRTSAHSQFFPHPTPHPRAPGPPPPSALPFSLSTASTLYYILRRYKLLLCSYCAPTRIAG